MDLPPSTIWKHTLTELEFQMTKATYNTWLKDARLARYDELNNTFVIAVRNEYALDWLQHRLKSTIEHTLSTIAGMPLFIALEVNQEQPPEPNRPNRFKQPPAGDPPPPPQTPNDNYVGFPKRKSNWTHVPDLFFEIITRPDIYESTKIFIAQIIYQTMGNSNKIGNAPEWWENVGYADITAVTGIKHRQTLMKAIQQSINHQWVKRRPNRHNQHNFDYALRYQWDPLNEFIQANLLS